MPGTKCSTRWWAPSIITATAPGREDFGENKPTMNLPNISDSHRHGNFKFYSKLTALFTGSMTIVLWGPFLQWQRNALRHIVKWKSETGRAAFNYSSEQQIRELACQANGEWCLEEQCIYLSGTVSNILSGQSQNINRLAIKAKGHSRAAKGVTINYQVRARVQVLVSPVTAQGRYRISPGAKLDFKALLSVVARLWGRPENSMGEGREQKLPHQQSPRCLLSR